MLIMSFVTLNEYTKLFIMPSTFLSFLFQSNFRFMEDL